MSKQIDESVVSLQFDNKRFESNVSQSMSTLDKLKAKLHLKGASKGLEEVNSAARKVDMNGLSNGVETVRAKFSAMEVIGVTALANITNSAVNAGKRIVSALTIDPIKSGFNEYETQINAVQTILANTESKGTTIDNVNQALDELNKYADQTIYNFTEMTRNIGTFTAAGVDLDTSVNAIKGIANLAAVSGSTSQQASTAMYQLSQALASGTVKLMDWNSVVNAGMGGEVFQNALKETARIRGIDIDGLIKTEGSFRETLKSGWLTSEILTETLEKFTLSTENMTEAEIKANRERLKSQGYTEDQIDAIFKLGATATDAATKVKTFSQMWEVMKESAQSGWAQTWELIFGDFEEAKALFTPLANFITGLIQKMSDFRNSLLEGALGSPLGSFIKKIEGFTQVTENMAEKLLDYSDIVKRIINGEFGNGQARWDKLTEMGYDWAHAQNLVNEELGNSYRRATNYTEAQAEATKQTVELTDAKLRELGLTEEEIKLYRELEAESKRTGKSMDEIIKGMDQMDGRTMLIESFKNAGTGLYKSLKAIGQAWLEIFPPMTSLQLYNIIKALHTFSENLKMSDETADKLKRTFKGLFALLDIILTVVGGPIKIAFKVLCQILGMFDLDLLSVTALVGDAIVKFRDWVDSIFNVAKIVEKLIPFVKNAAKAFANWFVELKNSDTIAGDIIRGLINGLTKGVSGVCNAVKKVASKLLETFRNILGIHSPSKETESDGENFGQGFINGIKKTFSAIGSVIKELGKWILDCLDNVLGPAIAIGAGVVMLITLKKIGDAFGGVARVMDGAGDIVQNLGKVVKSFANYINAKALQLKADALLTMAKAIGIIALSIIALSFLDYGKLWSAVGAMATIAAILVALSFAIGKLSSVAGVGKSAVLLVGIGVALALTAKAIAILSNIKTGKALVAAGIVMVIMVLMGKMLVSVENTSKYAKRAGAMLIKMSIALLLIAAVIKILSKIDFWQAVQGVVILAIVMTMMGKMLATSAYAGQYAGKAGSMILKMSIALLLIAAVIKILSKIDFWQAVQGVVILAIVMTMMGKMLATSAYAGQYAGKAGSMILKMSIALLLIAAVIKIMGKIDFWQAVQGVVILTVVMGLIAGLMIVSAATGQYASKAGSMILKMSIALLLIAGAMALLSYIKPEGILTATKAIAALMAMFAVLILATSAIKGTDGIAKIFTSMAMVIAVLAIALGALSFIKPEKLAMATRCLSVVIGMIALVVLATSKAKECSTTIGILAGIIGIVGGVLIALSALKVKNVLAAMTAVSVVLLALAVSLILIKNITVDKSSTAALIVIGAILAVLSGVLIVLSALPFQKTINAAIALGIVLLSLATALLIFSKIKVSAKEMGVAIAMAAVIGVLSYALLLLAKLTLGDAIKSAVSLGIVLLTLSTALLILGSMKSSALAGAASLLLVAAALAIIVPLMAMLGGMSWGSIGKALVALAGGFLVIGLGAVALGLAAPLIMAAAAAIAILGVGCLAAGIGIAIFAAGLSTLVLLGPQGLATFTSFAMAILSLLPLIVQQIGAAMIAFAQVLIEGAPAFTAALVALITMVLNAIIQTVPVLMETLRVILSAVLTIIAEYLPQIIELVLKGITLLLQGIAKYLPKIVQAGFDIIMAILKGIRDNIKSVAETAAEIIVELINGIANGIPKIIDAVCNLVLKMINGITDAIKKYDDLFLDAMEGFVSALAEALGKLAADVIGLGLLIVEGIIKGLWDGLKDLLETVKDLCEEMWDEIKDFFKIKSPSRLMMTAGRYIDEGFAIGLERYAKLVTNAAGDVSSGAYDALTNAVNGISKLEFVDAQPTIRPVLDLSDVASGANAISGMLTGRTIAVDASAVGIISASMAELQNRRNANDVASELKGLRKDINDMPRNSYNINGITYDDGSNITSAVESLVRAARIERRT